MSMIICDCSIRNYCVNCINHDYDFQCKGSLKLVAVFNITSMQQLEMERVYQKYTHL